MKKPKNGKPKQEPKEPKEPKQEAKEKRVHVVLGAETMGLLCREIRGFGDTRDAVINRVLKQCAMLRTGIKAVKECKSLEVVQKIVAEIVEKMENIE